MKIYFSKYNRALRTENSFLNLCPLYFLLLYLLSNCFLKSLSSTKPATHQYALSPLILTTHYISFIISFPNLTLCFPKLGTELLRLFHYLLCYFFFTDLIDYFPHLLQFLFLLEQTNSNRNIYLHAIS
jgi:hypothetical protein